MKPADVVASDLCMNTLVTYKVLGCDAADAIADAKSELSGLEHKLSRFISGSEIHQINLYAGLDSIKISRETYDLLSYAKLLSKISQGSFDITVAPLVDLWHYNRSLHAPRQSKILEILPLVNSQDLMLQQIENKVGLRWRNQSIDLGGIAKGYAADQCIKVFQQYDINSAYINIGGNVSTLGRKPDGSLWSVGIRHPRRDGLLGAVRVTGKAVVTSGDYERCFFDHRGKRWHHILNPTTGYPAESGLISATVVADSAIKADAFSTAIFVTGMENGLRYLKQFTGMDVILVDNRQQVYVSQGLTKYFQAVAGIEVSVI